jgi:hypothetical protein
MNLKRYLDSQQVIYDAFAKAALHAIAFARLARPSMTTMTVQAGPGRALRRLLFWKNRRIAWTSSVRANRPAELGEARLNISPSAGPAREAERECWVFPLVGFPSRRSFGPLVAQTGPVGRVSRCPFMRVEKASIGF